MNFLHTADLHLGKRLREVSLLDEQAYILSVLVRLAEENHCAAVLLSGDLYDKSAPSAEAVALFDQFVTELNQKSIAVLACAGNHDSADRVAYGSALLSKANVYVSPRFDGQTTRTVLYDDFGPVNFYLLPFLKPAVIAAVCPDAPQDSYDAALQYVISRCGADFGERNVILSHQYVTGGERSPSEDVPVGGVDSVSASLFDRFDYCALGHLHKPQSILRETVRYAGSPLKYSLDEWDSEKSAVLVSLREKGDCSVRLLPLLPKHNVRQIVGSYLHLTDRETYQNEKRDDFLSAVLTDEMPIPDALSKLRILYPNLLRLSYRNTQTSRRADGEELSEAVPDALTPLELFSALYEAQNNEPLSEAAATLAAEIWERTAAGGENEKGDSR